MKYSYLLPIGSFVRIKGYDRLFMITGYLQAGKSEPSQVRDYSAVCYPEGMITSQIGIRFNHADIEEVVYRGYEDKDRPAILFLFELLERSREEKAKEEEGAKGANP